MYLFYLFPIKINRMNCLIKYFILFNTHTHTHTYIYIYIHTLDTLSSFYQHVTIPTRGDNTLDCVYTNIQGAYRALPRPHLGLSDHITILLAPAYRPLLRRIRPTKKTVTVWPSDAAFVLQDCFQCTDWQVFKDAAMCEGEVDLEEYTSSVLGFISKCADDVAITRTVTCFPNQKPWLNAEVRALLKARDAAFRAGEASALKVARKELTAGIVRAKATYARKIQGHFTSNDPRSMWKGIKCIMDYNTRDAQCPGDPSLPDALNRFYARFEDPDTPPPCTRLIPSSGDTPLSVSIADVRRTLKGINPRKAAGPDNIPGRVLRDGAYQLSKVLTDIFNTSLLLASVPTCLKTATIVPVPKCSTVTGLNDYRPIALTPVVMKCFERLVMARIKDSIDVTVDPHQYAYKKIAPRMMPSHQWFIQPSPTWRAETPMFVCSSWTSHRPSIPSSHRSWCRSSPPLVWVPHWGTGSWTSWLIDLRLSGSTIPSPPPSPSALAHHRAVCWAPSCSLCWRMTARRDTPAAI